MNILIAEDEKDIAHSLRKNFEIEGYNSEVAYDGEEAIKLIQKKNFDLILLDWRMPKISGIQVLKFLKEEKKLTIPIILLTALTDISNKVEALEFGADDYITKPFSFNELIARIHAIMRRYKSTNKEIEFNNCILNLINRTIICEENELRLTDKEFELFKYLLENEGEIISREELCKNVWGLNFIPTTNIVEAAIKNLRKKLEELTGNKFIRTIYGEGYLFILD